MARGSKSFSAAVSDFALKSERRIEGVFREASRIAAAEMMKSKSQGGHLPVLTGRLRRSLMASTAGMPQVQHRAKDFPPNEAQIAEVIAGAGIGQSIFLGFQAPYAQKAEYDQGNGFVRLTAQRWQEIVAEATRRVISANP